MLSDLDQALLERARERAHGRCAYCDSRISPQDTGALEFHRPLSRGGARDDENALFVCRRCCVGKGAYWHETDPPHTPLLHPRAVRIDDHVARLADGRLLGTTPEGHFYVERLDLNAPSRVEERRRALDPLAQTLATAERVHDLLVARGRHTCVIGGVAVAVHGYLRATEDLDLAVVTGHLKEHVDALREAGIDASYEAPGDDPIQGIARVEVDGGDPIEIVNLMSERQRDRGLALEALQAARPLLEGSSLPVVGLPHLVAMKLVANGPQDRADVAMLLRGRTSDELAEIEAVCTRFSLADALARVRQESG